MKIPNYCIIDIRFFLSREVRTFFEREIKSRYNSEKISTFPPEKATYIIIDKDNPSGYSVFCLTSDKNHKEIKQKVHFFTDSINFSSKFKRNYKLINPSSYLENKLNLVRII